MKNNQTTFLKLCLSDALIKIMTSQDYDAINVNTICEKAQVGRTTFYRHFGNKNSKEELLRFKVSYEWERYKENHEEDFTKDKTFTLLNFIYENRKLFTLLNNSGVIHVAVCLSENLTLDDYPADKGSSYLKSFFVYGQFGAIYQWIKYDFDETPEQVRQHIVKAIVSKYAKNN